MSADWRWVNLPGGFSEELIADLCSPESGGASEGRGCIAVQTNATSSFHVTFSHTDVLPTRGTEVPVLRFVVGKRKNSMTSVGLGNPYIKKEPIDFTRCPDALLTGDPEKSRVYWFLYDRNVCVAAMGVQAAPQADLCRLVCRFRDAIGFRAEVCQNLRHVILSSGKRPVSLRVMNISLPPDISIPRYRFDPERWMNLPFEGVSCIFEPDEAHRRLVDKVQKILAASPIAPFYGLVDPSSFCLNTYRLIDTLRRGELFPGQLCDELTMAQCHAEISGRLAPVLASAPWTYFPLKFDRADCTAITLAPLGVGAQKAINSWVQAVKQATQLRNGATNRELLTLQFAFEVFPVEGENAQQARREVVREITALLEKEWGIMDFTNPRLVSWRTHAEYDQEAS